MRPVENIAELVKKVLETQSGLTAAELQKVINSEYPPLSALHHLARRGVVQAEQNEDKGALVWSMRSSTPEPGKMAPVSYDLTSKLVLEVLKRSPGSTMTYVVNCIGGYNLIGPIFKEMIRKGEVYRTLSNGGNYVYFATPEAKEAYEQKLYDLRTGAVEEEVAPKQQETPVQKESASPVQEAPKPSAEQQSLADLVKDLSSRMESQRGKNAEMEATLSDLKAQVAALKEVLSKRKELVELEEMGNLLQQEVEQTRNQFQLLVEQLTVQQLTEQSTK